MARIKRYFWNILIVLDQLLNAVLAGYPDETFSARSWRKAQAGQPFWRLLCWCIDSVFYWDCVRNAEDLKIKGHCQLSAESETDGNHRPSELRGRYDP